MAKLSKAQIKSHQQAVEMLKQDVLNLDEREFVVNNWQESATHLNSASGAFFTPLELARTFTVEVGDGASDTVIDLCAGIGCLSFALHERAREWGRGPSRIVCVEMNPDYVAIGRKVLPDAEWICANVFELPDLGRFTFAISNPPFGKGGPLQGVTLDLNVVAVAARLADVGAFILPSGSVPFKLSGDAPFSKKDNAAYARFHKQTGITLGPSCGIDCDFYRGDWRFASPSVEIAVAEFEARQIVTLEAQADLFGEAA
jgi:predicted RNA methylase